MLSAHQQLQCGGLLLQFRFDDICPEPLVRRFGRTDLRIEAFGLLEVVNVGLKLTHFPTLASE
ncbi:MAG: hypothetical protein QM742_17565 [Aquabacterium sp.]